MSIEQQAKGKKEGDIRYLTPLNIDTNKNKKYCRFKKLGIKYIDYKDPDFLLKFINEQGKLLPRRASCRHRARRGWWPEVSTKDCSSC